MRSLDVPMAAELLGKLIGLALAEGALPAGRLQELYGQCETAEYRRDFVAIALKYAKAWPVPAFAVGWGAGRTCHRLAAVILQDSAVFRRSMALCYH